jgi:hypothetical protein
MQKTSKGSSETWASEGEEALVFERATHFAIHCRLAGGTSVTWCLLDTVVSRSCHINIKDMEASFSLGYEGIQVFSPYDTTTIYFDWPG